MDLMDAIYSRRAVRNFERDPLDEATILKIIDASIQAPSAMNKQPWMYTVVRDAETLKTISREAKRHVLHTTPAGLMPDRFHSILEDTGFDILYGAPAMVVISGLQTDPWSTIDCSLAAQNLMLAAHALGLGSCWIGFAQGWLGTDEGKALIGLSSDRMAIAPIILGRPKQHPPRVERRSAEINWR